jgi:hypothetical protein
MNKLIDKIGDRGNELPLKSRYDKLCTDRRGYLDRGRDYSAITLPYLLPEIETNRGAAANDHGFNGFNAQAVNHLANRIVHNLFPAHQPFFALEFTEDEKVALEERGYDPVELAALLHAAVRKVHDREAETNGRLVMVNIMKHLIVAGNVVLYDPPEGDNLRAIPISHYCVTRDSSDSLLEIMTSQKKAFSTLPLEIQSLVKDSLVRKGKELKPDEEVELLTWCVRTAHDTFTFVQTVEDIQLDSRQEIKEDALPFLVLRWNVCFGEDYGRGLVEDQWSDFRVKAFLDEARMKGMVLMSHVVYLVRSGAMTAPEDLASADSGDFLVGNIDDVGILQLEKFAQFNTVNEAIRDYERRLGQVFLMHSAVQRDAERVTAYELRMQAQELNESLGGIYSYLTMALQKPYALLHMRRTGFPLSKEKVKPRILTGLEALSKAGDLDKIRVFTETLGMVQAWPPELQSRTDVYQFAKTIANSLSLDLVYIRNDEEQAAITQAQSQQNMMQQAGMEATKAIPNMIEQASASVLNGQTGQ